MQKLRKKLKEYLYAERVNGKIMRCGAERPSKDDRDFHVGLFGWGAYKPQNQIKIIKTVSVKSQIFNDCGWQSATAQKEVDENTELSVSSIVRVGRSKGLISQDGFSNLRDNQSVIKEFGISDKAYFNDQEPNWNTYSDPAGITPEVAKNAAIHKSQSFWAARMRDETLKLLDEGRPIQTAMDWYSDYNMYNGFASPFIIRKTSGVLIGGHAFLLKGYILQFKGYDLNGKIVTGVGGTDVYVFQNSYGPDWGATVVDEEGVVHRGLFFVDMNFFEVNTYGRYVQMDIPVDTGKFLVQYNYQNVKAAGSPAVYWIENGVKRAYPNSLTYLSFNGTNNPPLVLTDQTAITTLQAIPSGTDMDLSQSPLFEVFKIAVNPANYHYILEVLASKKIKVGFNPDAAQWIATVQE